ncbi:hypothetical protein [Ralstonia pseudosolanacearum]|uniref:hypothetical protein n=1 Tax=Ralstonia pseudosolanacearum TaxID=1310165 RepID=UPI000DAF3266|nr:hypothetical protein [Ralstonia pseudosolanacearum]RAA11774.1 hypothetical protein DOT79_19855 [Ralstonia pseudosolanacearum]
MKTFIAVILGLATGLMGVGYAEADAPPPNQPTAASVKYADVVEVFPNALYLAKHGTVMTYDGLHLRGHGFNTADPAANIVLFDGVGALQMCPVDKSTAGCTPGFVVTVIADGTELKVDGIPKNYAGFRRVAIATMSGAQGLGGAIPVSAPTVTFSPFGAIWPRVAALVVLVGSILLVLRAFAQRVPLSGAPTGTEIYRWQSLLVESDTNTFSLSRLQLVIWTLVTLFAWSYLSIARSVIQMTPTFGDIPGSLAGLLGISVGTTISTLTLNAVKGSKAAGPTSPSISDFISVGGVVAPDRLQYLLWTIIGAIAYVALTLSLDPASIQQYIELPSGFLTLSGISTAGYLGARVARNAGPNILRVTTVPDAQEKLVKLTVEGTALSKSGQYLIALSKDTGKGYDSAVAITASELQPPIEASEVEDGSQDLYKRLVIVFRPANGKWFDTPPQKGQFSIVNPDGQRADWPF